MGFGHGGVAGRGQWAAGAVLALCLLLAGCAGQGAEGDAVATPGPSDAASEEGLRQNRFDARLSVQVSGAANFEWSGDQELMTNRLGKPGTAGDYFAVGMELPRIVSEDGRDRFRWGMDLIETYRDQPGTFTISVSDPAKVTSNVLLIVMRVKDGTMEAVHDWNELDRYDEFKKTLEPCTAEVGPREASGFLTCPRLATEDGKQELSLRVTWGPR